MKTYFGIAVLLSTLLLAPTTWAIETSPDILVNNTAQEVLAPFQFYAHDSACHGQELV